jgi:putative DNA primase/helicase
MMPSTSSNGGADVASVLDSVVEAIQGFCVLPPFAAQAIALWCAFTFTHAAAHASPILLFRSPTKRCGKTTAMRVTGQFVRNPVAASSATPAVIFRMIEAAEGVAPTLLLDEADTYIHRNDDWRGIVNGGHTPDTAWVIRCDGKQFEPKRFSTWAPKALAMIGKPPETILDRSIVINLARKLPDQTVKKLRRQDRAQLHALRDQLASLIAPHINALRDATPALPPTLNDRAGDSWEPLLAIADLAGGHWPDTARRAATHLSGDGMDDDAESADLLSNIREVLGAHSGDSIFSAELVDRLIERQDWRWASCADGHPLTQKQLASRLEAFDIRSKTVRQGDDVRRAYMVASFQDAFQRYLRPLPAGTATPLQDGRETVNSGCDNPVVRPPASDDVRLRIPRFIDLPLQ